jgi:hypothetical protein
MTIFSLLLLALTAVSDALLTPTAARGSSAPHVAARRASALVMNDAAPDRYNSRRHVLRTSAALVAATLIAAPPPRVRQEQEQRVLHQRQGWWHRAEQVYLQV